MRARPTPTLPTTLDGVRREFEHWRRTRPPRSPIPEPLWALAVERARAAGVHATARRLRLNYYALKQRVESAPTFVELAPTDRPTGSAECLIELADRRGATLRISLKGTEPPDLVALSRALWSPPA
jgi:hypothetical protein